MARAWLATFRIGTRISRLRCALPYPLFVTVSGAQVGGLMGGSVIIEVIFGLPGVGYSLVQAIYNRDYPIVQVAAVYLAAVFVLVNLGVDLLYGVIDPRIKQN
jgi:peptide/nickel transport system permease protein